MSTHTMLRRVVVFEERSAFGLGLYSDVTETPVCLSSSVDIVRAPLKISPSKVFFFFHASRTLLSLHELSLIILSFASPFS